MEINKLKRKAPTRTNPPRGKRIKNEDNTNNNNNDELNKGILLIIDDLFNGFDNPVINKQIKTRSKTNKDDGNDLTCPNPLCDHVKGDKSKFKPVINITEIKNIDDIIELGKCYHCQNNTHLKALELRVLCKLVSPLTELKNMVGLKKVKEMMVNQILFFLQGLNIKYEQDGFGQITKNSDMMHTVITGPPGVGKTELGKILGKVYKSMGVLSKGTFKLVSRSDLVAKYLGQTAVKTQGVIDDCQGGVMFIDEAYSLGHKEGNDSFSKECLDTLNQNLTEKKDFLCIIAGYKDALDKCFFNMNEGLTRRFTFRYEIDGYTADELREIFEIKLELDKWKLEFKQNNNEELNKTYIEFFKKNKNNFPNYGGDIETLFLKCKIAHSRRVIFESEDKRRILTLEDIENGFKHFMVDRKGTKKEISMYD